MSKTLVLIFALVACSFAALPFEEIKGIVERDECSVNAMQTITPKIQEKIAILQQVNFSLFQDSENVQAKTELLALIDDVQAVYDSCNLNKKIQPALGDAVEAAGVGFLLASNCFKDVGALLLIGDSIIQDPSNVTNDIIVVIILYIMGRQGMADCQQFINYIL